MNKLVENKKIAFWEYIETTAEGDIVIKIKNKKAQEELAQLIQAGDLKLQAELEAKKKKDDAVTLADVEAFDNMIANLVDSDAVYVKAGKMTGRNLEIDWDKAKAGSNKKTSNGGGARAPRQVEAIKVDAVFEF